MLRPSVFISHSTEASASDPYVTAVADALAEDDAYDVLLDRSLLRVSDDWNSRIINWLASCHAAIVVFSERALPSEYVKFEVANLYARWRRAAMGGADDEFVFCGVLPAGIDPARLRTGYYAAFQLTDAQLLPAATPDVAVAGVLQRLEPLRQRAALPATPFDELQTRVSVVLGTVHPRLLKLGLAAVGRAYTDAAQEALAVQLANALLCAPLARALAAIQKMQPMPAPAIRDLFELLAPCWVGPEAALALLDRVGNAGNTAAHVTLNAERADFTPRMYLQRASGNLFAASGQMVEVTTLAGATGIQPAAVEYAIRRALLEQLNVAGVDAADPASVEALREELQFQHEAGRATLVAMKVAPERLASVRTAIRGNALPGVVLVALAGARAPLNDPLLLRPELQERQEDAAYVTNQRAKRIVEALARD